jgi:hypothetical protein
VREGACIGAATMLQPWTLRLILNVEVDAALAAASPTWARLSADGILVHMTKPFFSTHLEIRDSVLLIPRRGETFHRHADSKPTVPEPR